jgi:DNA polymerase III delta subunit
MIALVVGPDASLARAEVARLVDAHDPGGLNTTRLDGKAISIEDAVAAISTPSFFGGGRVVVIDDLMGRASRSVRTETQEGSEAGSTPRGGLDFAALFAAVAGENCLILVDQSLMSIPASVRKAAPADAFAFGGEPPRGAALIEWIQARANCAGTTIDGRVARLLAERLYPQTWSSKPTNPAFDNPPDLDRLGNEIDKLALAAHPGEVDAEIVRSMTVSAGEDRLFPFVEAVATSRLDDALPAFASLQAAGDEAGRIAAHLFQQFELAAVVAAAGGAADPASVGKAVGLSNPNRMIGIARTAKRARISPQRMVSIALDADRKSKRGVLRQPADVVYHLMSSADPAGSERE